MTSLFKQFTKNGKAIEHLMIYKLLKKELNVFVPVIDIDSIDMVIKNEKENYIEIQVKSRTINNGEEDFKVKEFKPKDNLFFICHNFKTNDFYVVSSSFFHQNAILRRSKRGLFRHLHYYKIIEHLSNFKNEKGLDFLKSL